MKKSLKTIFSTLLVMLSVFVLAQQANEALQRVDRGFFIENKGQWHSDVLYLYRMGGLDAWITKYGVNYTFYKVEKTNTASAQEGRMRMHEKLDRHEDEILLGHRVLFELEGHNANPQPEGKNKMEGYYNYLIGNDPAKHATYVGLYKEAWVKNVYEGIDMRYYIDKGYLRYDFVVNPMADASKIKFKLRGQYSDGIKEGKVVYSTRFGEVEMTDLHTYQGKQAIASRFVKEGEAYRIALGTYDKTKSLTIDPLIYSTYIGGSGSDYGYGIAIDGSGNAYVTGYTGSTDYDITAGAFQTSYAGVGDVFVTKLNATGGQLVYSTYIGGSGEDRGQGIAIDGSGNAYVTGYTESPDYDITAGASQTTHGGLWDAFVTKLNATGTALVYSTYIGGSNDDYGYGIAIDGSGNAYITGLTTWSTNFPVTTGAFQTMHGGSFDVFVTKLNTAGTALVYSTYIGGSSYEEGCGIAIDGSGNAYVVGYTQSTNYDITPGAFQTSYEGGGDAFVTKLNATGDALVYSTYIGGSYEDYGYGIAIDGSGNAYVVGYTQSTNYDIIPGAFQTSIEGIGDAFVTKLNATGTGLVYSTYIGGSGEDIGSGIAIDGNGNAYVTGETESMNYDITPGAFQTTHGGDRDVFVTKLNATGNALLYSTYIGGSAGDRSFAIAIDGSGNAYLTGDTQSTNYDITVGAFQTSHGGGNRDVFVTKLDLSMFVGVEEGLLSNEVLWLLYPNPSFGKFTIRSENHAVFDIIDVHGKNLSSHLLNAGTELNFDLNLPAGLYFIREQNSGTVQKLVITY